MPETSGRLSVDSWTDRILHVEQARPIEVLPWQAHVYETYRERLLQPDYPCFFGQMGERKGEVFYAFVDRGQERGLAQILRRFAGLSRAPRFSRYSLSVFVEPAPTLQSHSGFIEYFWSVLGLVSSVDEHSPVHGDPDTPLWEFSYDGVEMFVVGLSPTYRARRSRNLGPGVVLLFQPRQLFIDPDTGKALSVEARRTLHRRILAFDGMPVHPDIGFYGDPGNREWKQYALPDGNEPVRGVCPFKAAQRSD